MADLFRPYHSTIRPDVLYCLSGKPRKGGIAVQIDETVVPGRYRHFKGKEYEVLFVAQHSETLEPMVVYRALYGERGLWVRPASMWNETVERDGKTVRRFVRLEEET